LFICLLIIFNGLQLRPSVLAEILRRNDSTELQQIAIIDVREEDRIGGVYHYPSNIAKIEQFPD